MLGDDYISQHISQSYRDYLEQTSYKAYMSNMAKGIVTILSGNEPKTSWGDVLNELEGNTAPEQQTETEQEIKSRLLAKLNGREGA